MPGSVSSDPAQVVVPEYGDEGPGGDGALLRGTLIVDGPCLYVEAVDSTRWLVVFKADAARWEDNAILVNDEATAAGDPISLGGGEGSGLLLSGLVTAPDDSCDSGHVWLVS